MCSLNVLVVAIVAGGLAILLQGCGGDGAGGSTSTQTTSTTTTTTTTAPPGPRTPPLSVPNAVKYLNSNYLGFDEKNDSSPLGLTISMAAQPDSFFKNIYCSKYNNPLLRHTGCSLGRTDCRMSASLYNHKMIVSNKTGSVLMGLSRSTGFVINVTKVQAYLGKCAFIWDGASDRRYNIGCGDGCPGSDCTSHTTAFDNICPSTGKVCTAEDIEVKRSLCKPWGTLDRPPTHGNHTQCVFPGAAIDYHMQGINHYKPGKDFTREMAKARVQFTNGSDGDGPNIEKWNEVVIDEHLLMPELWNDPAPIIPAFVYAKSQLPTSRTMAESMRDEFCKYMQVDKIPVVEVNDLQKAAGAPFADPDDESTLLTV